MSVFARKGGGIRRSRLRGMTAGLLAVAALGVGLGSATPAQAMGSRTRYCDVMLELVEYNRSLGLYELGYAFKYVWLDTCNRGDY